MTPVRVFVSEIIRLTKAYIKMSTDRLTQKHGSLPVNMRTAVAGKAGHG